ncbi:MAG: energy-coupling factor transporter transmembrane component T [Desulfobacterales bacterium]
MAELTSFGFRAGTSLPHRLDVRFKLFFLILISLICLNGDFLRLGIFTGLLTVLIIHSGLPLRSGLKGLRFFLFLLVLVLMARMVTTPGDALFEIKSYAVTRQGILSGILICWRLTLVVLLGFVFVFTTRSLEIKAAVEWVLKPLRFIPGKRIATMMSLATRFVPVILNQANETAEAQRARCVENRKNPVYRLIRLGIPLIRRAFEQADKLAVAMEARCYTENRTDPELSATRTDWITLGVMILICSLAVSI